MTTITKEIVIPKNRRVSLDVELPPDGPEGKARVTLIFEGDAPADDLGARRRRLCGLGKGKVFMSDDFAAPLDDFVEYQ